jgi:hypothetical protein
MTASRYLTIFGFFHRMTMGEEFLPLMVVGCRLVRHGIAERDDVLEKIKELRRFEPRGHWPSPETAAQIRMVLSWRKGE